MAQGQHLGDTWRVELAQAAAPQPSADSESACRDRPRVGERAESDATRIKTIHPDWRWFQAHRPLHDSALARPAGRGGRGSRVQQARRGWKINMAPFFKPHVSLNAARVRMNAADGAAQRSRSLNRRRLCCNVSCASPVAVYGTQWLGQGRYRAGAVDV